MLILLECPAYFCEWDSVLQNIVRSLTNKAVLKDWLMWFFYFIGMEKIKSVVQKLVNSATESYIRVENVKRH